MKIVIHANPGVSNQRNYAASLVKGFSVHGLTAEITPHPVTTGDIHVIIGPWYAKKYWIGYENVILVDRCYYRGHPGHSSIGWMNHLGGRDFKLGCGREAPQIKEKKSAGGSIFLADYDGPVEQADTVRLHPSRRESNEELLEVLSRHAIAIGYETSALVTAALEGLQVICKGKTHILLEPNWLELLPYADWSHEEIRNGELWNHLNS